MKNVGTPKSNFYKYKQELNENNQNNEGFSNNEITSL